MKKGGAGLIRLDELFCNKVALIAMSGRVVQAAGWLLAVPLITTMLTPAEQGFYYTFLSLAALQVFVELGMTGVVVQAVAHETAHFEKESVGVQLECDEHDEHKARLSSVLRFSLWWFGIAGCLCALALSFGGWSFLSSVEASRFTGVLWHGPWLAMSVITAGTVWSSGVLAILEGFGYISVTVTVRLVASVLGLLGLVSGLALGVGIWSVPLSTGIVVLVTFLGSGVRFFVCVSRGLAVERSRGYSWLQEIWPFQWRIALSWMSGWFIFQAMTPSIMKAAGAEAAGRFGLALQVANGVQALAVAWTQVRAPAWGMMIARREWHVLDADFWKWTLVSIVTAIVGALSVVTVLLVVKTCEIQIGDRVPVVAVVLPLLVVSIANQWVFSIASYLRAHKREPFLWLSLSVAGVLFLCLQIPFLVQERVLPWVYCSVSLFLGAGGGTVLWIKLRAKWHSVEGKVGLGRNAV